MAEKESPKITLKKLCTTYYRVTFTQKVNRLPRSYFWIFQVFIIGVIYLAGACYFAGTNFLQSDNQTMAIIMFVLAAIVFFAGLLSNVEVNIARLHDSNHSGFNLLWNILPYIGWLVAFAMLGFFKSTEGDNDYGKPFDYDELKSLPTNPKNLKKPFEFEEYDINKSIKLVQKHDGRSPSQKEDEFDSEEYWGLISFAYGKIKQTTIFKLWRKEQFDCQFGKCAICNKPMELRFAQVDHIKPRYKKGTNYSNNLALVHKKCNELKGAKSGYERPDWIKSNKYSEGLDEKVYEITEEIRADYPTKFPNELFERPTHKV